MYMQQSYNLIESNQQNIMKSLMISKFQRAVEVATGT